MLCGVGQYYLFMAAAMLARTARAQKNFGRAKFAGGNICSVVPPSLPSLLRSSSSHGGIPSEAQVFFTVASQKLQATVRKVLHTVQMVNYVAVGLRPNITLYHQFPVHEMALVSKHLDSHL